MRPKLTFNARGQWFWKWSYLENWGTLRHIFVGPYPNFDTCAKAALHHYR